MTQKEKSAFTLAEVLITLGIIGVVAAMTMPTLIQNYKKHVVETRLEKFYSMINQAIQMSETVNGDKKYWDALGSGFEKDEDNNPDYTKPEALAWFEKYLKPYLKYTKIETFNNLNTYGYVLVYFEDGSLLQLFRGSWTFYPNFSKLKITYDETGLSKIEKSTSGIDSFCFYFAPKAYNAYGMIHDTYHFGKGVEPYMSSWDGTREGLLNDPNIGCNKHVTNEPAFCTKLIQLNGWKIPKDYPFKF